MSHYVLEDADVIDEVCRINVELTDIGKSKTNIKIVEDIIYRTDFDLDLNNITSSPGNTLIRLYVMISWKES